MARKLKISATILNIRLHPHSEDIYARFIKSIFKKRASAVIHGDRLAMISSLDTTKIKVGLVSGVVSTFTKIDINGEWFDAANLKDATEDQIEKISIPANLYPNLASFYFRFDLKKHRITIQMYSKGKVINANQVKKFIETVSSQEDIVKEFGQVKITIVQSREGLAKMFALKRIRRIQILIEKPNADVFSDNFEEDIESHMEATRTRKVSLTYEAETGSSIIVDDNIKRVTQAALDNGEVKIDGNDHTGAVSKSTTDSPKILQNKYDPDILSEQQAFNSLAQDQAM